MRIIILIIGGLTCFTIYAQDTIKSTNDLAFLVGEWEVLRTYGPQSETPRDMSGTLSCEETMDGTFIHCIYEMERPGKIRGLDVVYFNYNSIYDTYESLWLSSTWPIKVLMQGTLEEGGDNLVLRTSAQFQIENGVTEYVKGELVTNGATMDLGSFTRQTMIRTSEYEEGEWYHHMTEVATRTDK